VTDEPKLPIEAVLPGQQLHPSKRAGPPLRHSRWSSA